MKGRVVLSSGSWLLLWTQEGEPRVLEFPEEEDARVYARTHDIKLG